MLVCVTFCKAFTAYYIGTGEQRTATAEMYESEWMVPNRSISLVEDFARFRKIECDNCERAEGSNTSPIGNVEDETVRVFECDRTDEGSGAPYSAPYNTRST